MPFVRSIANKIAQARYAVKHLRNKEAMLKLRIQQRQSDFAVLITGTVQQMLHDEGIMLLDYRALQRVWGAGIG